MLTNLLNPKVGVFYISFLPQFLPEGVAVVPFSVLLAALHGVMGLLFFAAISASVAPFQRALRRVSEGVLALGG